MVQISKLSKDEIKSTGFNKKAIASRFMQTVLNRKERGFKKKEGLIKTLTKEYKEMTDFEIDRNETSKIDRTIENIEKKTKNIENIKEEFDNYLIKKIYDDAVQRMKIQEYFKKIKYKVPSNTNFTGRKKEIEK